MKTKLIATVSLAFTMVSLSAQAIPISPFLAMQLEKKVLSDGFVQPLKKPGLLQRLDSEEFALRSSIPAVTDESRDMALRLSKMPMLDVFPMDQSWQMAALPDRNPLVITPSPDNALPPIEPFEKAAIPQSKLQATKKDVRKLPSARRFNTRGNALAPMAYVEFCTKNKSQCAASGNKEVKLTFASLEVLKRINRQTNRAIRPRNESRDVWNVNVKSGDCEDYALTKRAKLIKKGFPASALRMAVGRIPGGEGHAVLVVSTNRGDFVLDNRNNSIRPFHRTDLAWIKIQGKQNPLLWHQI